MRNLLRAFLDRPNDDPVKTFGVAGAVALVAALLVSTTSVVLQPLQQVNIEREQAARMAALLDALPGLRDLMQELGITALETRMVDLQSGAFATATDPAGFDYEAAVQSETASLALDEAADIAGLRRIPAQMPVHLLEREGDLELVVLPVRGVGYQSTITGLLALEPSLDTIAGLTILEHGETPGLGARILDPGWQAQWPGTAIRDDGGALAVAVVRDGATEAWEVDGITGATRTSNGVQNMLRFWLGANGFGPFLDRLGQGGL